MSQMSRIIVTAAFVVGTSVVLVTPASAATLCAYDSGTKTLNVTSQGSTVTLATGSGYFVVNDTDCSLMSQLDTVNIDMANAGGADLVFDLTNGPFGPGATDEGNGSSEIEFAVSNIGNDTTMSVEGSSGNDDIAAGIYPTVIHGLVGQVNLNVAADGATPDADIAIYGDFPEFLQLDGRSGSDVLSGAGLGFGGSQPYNSDLTLDAGQGSHEQLTGGSGNDTLITGTGDTVGDFDTYSGGAGHDVLFLNAGHTTSKADYSLDDVANDGVNCPGLACEYNNVHSDIESVYGSPANEHFEPSPKPMVISGGLGNDVIEGGGGRDVLEGDYGKDVLKGGAGKDLLEGGKGPDVLRGGPGYDTVSYEFYRSGVSVSLNGLADDGKANEHDNIASDIEDVLGTDFNDSFAGNGYANVFEGNLGDDTFFGHGGMDTLWGGAGDDTFNGGPGVDRCVQGTGTGAMVSCEQTSRVDRTARLRGFSYRIQIEARSAQSSTALRTGSGKNSA